jgi:glutaredoxin-like YruB-family protein
MIKLYSTPTCTYCLQAKKYLREKGVQFIEYDVAANPFRAEEMLHKSKQQGVPVFEINGRIIVGFDRKIIDLELSRLY